MQKNIFIIFIFLLSSFAIIGQDKKSGAENIYTALKPADATPAVFSSQDELNAKVPGKKANLITLIKENASDTGQVRILREQLWRFENAVVKPSSNNK